MKQTALKIFIISIAIIICISTVQATLYYFQGYDDETLTVDTGSVVQFTQSKLNPGGSNKTQRVICTVEDNPINYWYGEGIAGAPTTSSGLTAIAGGSFDIIGYENINSFGMISQVGTATVNVQYETIRTLQ